MLCRWPHPRLDAGTLATSTPLHLPKSLLLFLPHLFRTFNTDSSVTLLQLLSPRCKRFIVLSRERSHPGTRKASNLICTLEAQIPRCISHISDEAEWFILSIDGDLIDARSVVQYGLDMLQETATSSVTRLETSSQWFRRRVCRSSLSKWWSRCTINGRRSNLW